MDENVIEETAEIPIFDPEEEVKEITNNPVDCPIEKIATECDSIENDLSANSISIEKPMKTVKSETTSNVAADLTKRLRNMDTTLKENKFIKGLGNFMVGVKNKMIQNDADTATQERPFVKDSFLKKLKTIEIVTPSPQDENSFSLFERQLEVLFGIYDLNYNIMEPTTDSDALVVYLKPENVSLAGKFKNLKDTLLELDEISAKKDSLNEEVILYMKYFHSLKDIFEINGSIYLEPLETRLQKLYTSCKTYVGKLEEQIKRYDSVLEKFESNLNLCESEKCINISTEVAEKKDKTLNFFNEENKTLKTSVAELTSKLNENLCLHQEIETVKNSYLATLIQNSIQQNNLNQSILAAKQTQAAFMEKKLLTEKLQSDIDRLRKKNLSLKKTMESQTNKIKTLEDEINHKMSILDATNLESTQKTQQLENELLRTKQLLETADSENLIKCERLAQLECQIELDKRTSQVKIKSLQQLIQSFKKEKTCDEKNDTDPPGSNVVEDSTPIKQDLRISLPNEPPSNQNDEHSLYMTIYSLKEDIQTLNDELNDKNIIIEELSSDLRNYKKNSAFNILTGSLSTSYNANDPQIEANVATTLQALVEHLIAKNLILEENVSTLAKEIERLKKENPS